MFKYNQVIIKTISFLTMVKVFFERGQRCSYFV